MGNYVHKLSTKIQLSILVFLNEEIYSFYEQVLKQTKQASEKMMFYDDYENNWGIRGAWRRGSSELLFKIIYFGL